MLNKPTVTVAISAYNEEKNIKNFLESVLAQKEMGFAIEAIWIFSDGSTDKTVSTIKSLKDKRIKVFEDKVRRGKSGRLNQIYSKLESDILIQSDADVIFAHPYVVYDIIQPLLKKTAVGMCGGNPIPLTGETFTEKAVNCTVNSFLPLRKTLRGGNNIFSVDGRILAYKKELVKKMHIPEDMIANDAFTYFLCLTKGYEYRFVENAVVNFRSPQNLADHIKQNTRFKAARLRMYKYFPDTLVRHEQNIPKGILLKNQLTQYLKHPILCIYIFFVNKYCKYKAYKNEENMDALWKMAWSSKLLVKNN